MNHTMDVECNTDAFIHSCLDIIIRESCNNRTKCHQEQSGREKREDRDAKLGAAGYGMMMMAGERGRK